ncbi:unnamed protein product [Prunus armeniaca]|uniref:Uncharacterized protein n=1 Tax=Prunus armeniaca TaxID=36596 RepID=A0A6J5X6W1_PRUAR|nr:unnamed protein product [Prunus armeniaca]
MANCIGMAFESYDLIESGIGSSDGVGLEFLSTLDLWDGKKLLPLHMLEFYMLLPSRLQGHHIY